MKKKIIQLKIITEGLLALLLLIAWPASTLLAQSAAKPVSPLMQGYVTGGSTANWLEFREDVTLNPATIFEDLKKAFELSNDDQMKIQRTQDDNIGYKHYRYQQYYKNRKVIYGEFIVHQNNRGVVQSANGRLITHLDLSDATSLNEAQALKSALHFMNAPKYLWQNPEMEKELKRQEKNENATYYPKGELVYVPGTNDAKYDPQLYHLAWKFEVRTDGTDVMSKAVYVDANTGNVIHNKDIAMNCSTSGSSASAFNGNVTIRTELNGASYRSHNDCQTTDFYVYNCNRGTAVTTFYTDADNNWTNASAVQAQYGVKSVYDYYLGEHTRTSWNNSAGDMIVYNNAGWGNPVTVNNACWGCFGNATIYGAGNTSGATDDWNTLDIMGHEFTHGVTQDEAGLVYQNESGALNESFSDIFGEMVESYTTGTTDYLIGGDRGAIRNMANPNQYNDPDTYLGTNWYTGTADNGGVHTNSGVQNFWFYLASEGGSGTNDLGKTYNVTGVTRFKVRDIAYRSLANYLTSSSTYIDARAGSLRAAFDLYGACSAEIQAVGDAWHAVGVESQSPQYINDVCGAVASGSFKQAISRLTGNACGTGNTINTGTTMTYYAARDQIILYPGFRAPVGSRFTAYREPCSSTMYKGNGNDHINMSDAEKGIKSIVPIVSAREAANTVTANESISINPNPFTTSFELSINAKQDVKAQVTIFNSLGSRVDTKAGINVSKGFNKIHFDGANMSKGVYMVEINMNGEKTVKKIIKM